MGYTQVGRIEKVEHKEEDMRISFTTTIGQHKKTWQITGKEIDTIKILDMEEPDMVKDAIKWDKTDVHITTKDAELIVRLNRGIQKQDNGYVINMLTENKDTGTLTTKHIPLKDVLKVEHTKESENKNKVKRTINQRVNNRFIVENVEKHEKGKPIRFHKILNE
jgi:hypothetical protein